MFFLLRPFFLISVNYILNTQCLYDGSIIFILVFILLYQFTYRKHLNCSIYYANNIISYFLIDGTLGSSTFY